MFSAKPKRLHLLMLATALAVAVTGCGDVPVVEEELATNEPSTFGEQVVTIHSPLANELYGDDSPLLTFTATEGETTAPTAIPKERLSYKVSDLVGGVTQNVTEVLDAVSNVELPPKQDGLHKLEFVVNNETLEIPNFVTILFYSTDTHAPQIQVTIPPDELNADGIWETSDPTPLVDYAILDECFETDTCDVSIVVYIDDPDRKNPITLRTSDLDPDCTGECLPTLDDGLHIIQIVITDSLGHANSFEFSVIVDATPPVVVVEEDPPPVIDPTDPAPTVESTVEGGVVTITASADGTAVVTLDDTTVLDTIAVTADTEYQITLPSDTLDDGLHTIDVVVTDSQGNEGSAESSFLVDATAPELIIAIGDPGGLVLIQPNLSTNQDSGVLIFSANEDGSADVSLDETVIASYPEVIAGTSYLVEVNGLSEGAHTITIEMADGVGNVSSMAFDFLVDLDAPSVNLTLPGADALYADKVVPLAYQYSDDFTATENLGVVVTVSVWDDVNGTWVNADSLVTELTSYAVTVAEDGSYQVTVTVTDESLNATAVSSQFSVDTTAPVVEIISPAHESVTADNTPRLSVYANEQSSYDVRIFLFSGQYRDYTEDPDWAQHVEVDGDLTQADGSPLLDGTYTVVVEITDAAGWVGSGWSTFQVEAVGPEVAIIEPSAGDIVTNGTALLKYSVHNASDVEIYLSRTGDPLPTEPAISRVIDPVQPEPRTYTDHLEVSANGDYTVTIKSFDRSGSVELVGADVSVSFVADSSGVEITFPGGDDLYFRSEDTIPLTFNYNQADTVVVKLDGLVLAGVDPANQPILLGPGLAQGSHTVVVIGTNSSRTASDSVEFFIDDSPVEIEIKSPQEGRTYKHSSIRIHYKLREADWVKSETVSLDGVVLEGLTAGNHGHYNVDGHSHHDGRYRSHGRRHHHRNHNYRVEGIAPGDHTITVTALDENGNELAQASVSFTVEADDDDDDDDDEPGHRSGRSSCNHDSDDDDDDDGPLNMRRCSS